jgi:hypothetical protein
MPTLTADAVLIPIGPAHGCAGIFGRFVEAAARADAPERPATAVV